MTVTNPFSLTVVTTAETADAGREAAITPVTPYDTLCADATRPAAFNLTFREPTAA